MLKDQKAIQMYLCGMLNWTLFSLTDTWRWQKMESEKQKKSGIESTDPKNPRSPQHHPDQGPLFKPISGPVRRDLSPHEVWGGFEEAMRTMNMMTSKLNKELKKSK